MNFQKQKEQMAVLVVQENKKMACSNKNYTPFFFYTLSIALVAEIFIVLLVSIANEIELII